MWVAMRMPGLVADCAFCERIERCISNVEETCEMHGEWACSFEPLYPVTPGHLLFVASTHVRDAGESAYISGKVFEQAARYARSKRRRDDPELTAPCNLITSCGPEATQSIMHLHVHYIPREAQDGLMLPWTEQGWDQ